MGRLFLVNTQEIFERKSEDLIELYKSKETTFWKLEETFPMQLSSTLMVKSTRQLLHRQDGPGDSGLTLIYEGFPKTTMPIINVKRNC